MKYMLDTNICIYIIKKKPLGLYWKFNHFPIGDIGISSVTFSELCYGVENSSLEKKEGTQKDWVI